MSYYSPFIAHVRILPRRGRRFEHIRSLQRISRMIYDSISSHPDFFVTTPGGGQSSQLYNFMNSDYANGFAVVPQFGEIPAQITVTGFYKVLKRNDQPNPPTQIIHSGEFVTGSNGEMPFRIPGIQNDNDRDDLIIIRSQLDSIIGSVFPVDNFRVFRLEYKGVVYGDRHHHFPHDVE